MSGSICWKPVDPLVQVIPCWAPSHFQAAMEEVFGAPPWVLMRDAVRILKGMAAMSNDGAGKGSPYRDLVELIEQHGPIEVWMEH